MGAVSSPLIDFPIAQAKGIVLTITGSSDMTLQEVNAAAQAIFEMSDPDANIIFGAQVDDNMGGVISVPVVATGFSDKCSRALRMSGCVHIHRVKTGVRAQ